MTAPLCQYCTTELFKILYCKIENLLICVVIYYLCVLYKKISCLNCNHIQGVVVGGKELLLYCNIQTEHILKCHEMDLLFIFNIRHDVFSYHIFAQLLLCPPSAPQGKFFLDSLSFIHTLLFFPRSWANSSCFASFPLSSLDSFNISFFELYLKFHIMSHCIFYFKSHLFLLSKKKKKKKHLLKWDTKKATSSLEIRTKICFLNMKQTWKVSG